MAQDSIKAFEHERTKVFQVEDGLLLYKKDKRLYVPDWFNLRRSLVRECHDTKWAGHQELSVQGPCSRKHYYWPKMRDEIEKYVRACLVCQRDKTEQCLSRGKLEPLPILTRPWESVSMDFIVGLPKVGELRSILLFADRSLNIGSSSQPLRNATQKQLPNFRRKRCEILGRAEEHSKRSRSSVHRTLLD